MDFNFGICDVRYLYRDHRPSITSDLDRNNMITSEKVWRTRVESTKSGSQQFSTSHKTGVRSRDMALLPNALRVCMDEIWRKKNIYSIVEMFDRNTTRTVTSIAVARRRKSTNVPINRVL